MPTAAHRACHRPRSPPCRIARATSRAFSATVSRPSQSLSGVRNMSIFSDVEPIRFAGPAADSEFAYRVYDKNRLVLGKRMEEWLKVAVCYWHSFNWPGADVFGAGTLTRPWL